MESDGKPFSHQKWKTHGILMGQLSFHQFTVEDIHPTRYNN